MWTESVHINFYLKESDTKGNIKCSLWEHPKKLSY